METATCRICGREFKTRTSWDKICSPRCRAEAERRNYYRLKASGYKPTTKEKIADWDWQTESIRIDLQLDNAIKDAYSRFKHSVEETDSRYSKLAQVEMSRHKAIMSGIRQGKLTEVKALAKAYQNTKYTIRVRSAERKVEKYKSIYKPVKKSVSNDSIYRKLQRDLSKLKNREV